MIQSHIHTHTSVKSNQERRDMASLSDTASPPVPQRRVMSLRTRLGRRAGGEEAFDIVWQMPYSNATIAHSMPSLGACLHIYSTVKQATVMTFNKADTVNVYTFKPWNFQQLMTSLDRNCLVSAAICCLGIQCNSHVQHIPANHSWEITTCIVDLPAY